MAKTRKLKDERFICMSKHNIFVLFSNFCHYLKRIKDLETLILTAMREIVHLQAGQCGNQIGAKVRTIFGFMTSWFQQTKFYFTG